MMNYLLQLKVKPQWLILVRTAVALALGALGATLTANGLSQACAAELDGLVRRLFGL